MSYTDYNITCPQTAANDNTLRLISYRDALVSAHGCLSEKQVAERIGKMKDKAEAEFIRLTITSSRIKQRAKDYASEYPIRLDMLLYELDDIDWMSKRIEQLGIVIRDLFGGEFLAEVKVRASTFDKDDDLSGLGVIE